MINGILFVHDHSKFLSDFSFTDYFVNSKRYALIGRTLTYTMLVVALFEGASRVDALAALAVQVAARRRALGPATAGGRGCAVSGKRRGVVNICVYQRAEACR